MKNEGLTQPQYTHMDKGQKKYQDFVKGLADNPTSFYAPIKKNRLDFFSQDKLTTASSKQKQLKEECQLFSKLLIFLS